MDNIYRIAISLIDPKSDNIPTTITANPGAAKGQQGWLLNRGLLLTYTVLGAIAVLMIVIAGLRYVVAAGDKDKIASSKKMIIYTVVGIVVMGTAATLVDVVLGRLK